MSEKATPVPTPETMPYWEGAKAGQLRIQRCHTCRNAFFYPRISCPGCGSDDVAWFTASGQATLTSYIINHRAARGFTAPYVIAIVTLAEGPRLTTNIVGVQPHPDALRLDMPLQVRFEQRGDVAVPVFTPAHEVTA
ncbi:hypothetical protein AMIS_27090 [Actinoplanes missouriensis 431]|uniref:DUF35 domain-containing protein n=1 Tax=Actinoplanes missouriensis (strain ATCC 14538 / DSM 43046 / CBS 188.64 / JCM 3121 / NBRC 102363 / NCIMB 12654 / NRRL B-3342 / UNCC 431) TaxID=512565 RepID=I0H4J2_ACTM4|nr:OB-fold domain-containing protein [Actinoplanes missouriensis]BAL87929.1 hypothetical protein AMIS_27090 [Actinoplanes missouriensis 431]